jgi:hypothetical protein
VLTIKQLDGVGHTSKGRKRAQCGHRMADESALRAAQARAPDARRPISGGFQIASILSTPPRSRIASKRETPVVAGVPRTKEVFTFGDLLGVWLFAVVLATG